MIPVNMINAWGNSFAPWSSPTMVEQDLIISRALVNLYEQPKVRESLVFRGGTALNKLYIQPPARYSEDIDFVQIKSEPIGPTLSAIRLALDHWLGEPKRKLTERSVKLIYKYQNTDNLFSKLKIEINTTEHCHMLDLVETDFSVKSEWFNGGARIMTYQINELMGTKMRALYQRKKGRDLFDLWYVLKQNLIDVSIVSDVFKRHCARDEQVITRALFEKSLEEKKQDPGFCGDMNFLVHPSISYDFEQAYHIVKTSIVEKLPGEPWKKLALEVA